MGGGRVNARAGGFLGRSWTHFSQAFFRRLFFPIFGDVGSIWAGFGKSERKPKSNFGSFFFDAFFECVSASIFNGCWEAQNLKNSNFPLEKQ